MGVNINGVKLLNQPEKWLQHIEIPEYNAPFLVRGGDWQTLYNRVFKTANLATNAYDQVLTIDLNNDGHDQTLAFVNHSQIGDLSRITRHPYVVLFHGLGGGGDSIYMRQTAEAMTSAGYCVIRINMRGADEVASMARGFYHAGKTDDMREILKGLSLAIKDFDDCGFILMGYSLGANQVIKYLAEDDCHPAIKFAVAISPPIDLAATQDRLMAPRNNFYQRYLVKKLKNMLAKAARSDADFAFSHLVEFPFKSVLDFDERVVAPMYGYEDAADYYQQCSSAQFLPHAQKPLLLIHAASDPWIPNEPLAKAAEKASSNCFIVETEDGGHVGFHIRGSMQTWYDALLVTQAKIIAENIFS